MPQAHAPRAEPEQTPSTRRFDRHAASGQVALNPQAAFETLLTAAKRGFLDAQTALGLALLNGHGCEKDAVAAYRWFSLAAMHGYAEAVNMTGRCHMHGWGTSADPSKGAACYRAAADGGHAWAQFNYAECLFSGQGVAADRDQALVYFARAAEQGHAKAMNMLARAHEEGWGRPVDMEKARALYALAAKGGDFRACFNLALICFEDDADAEGDGHMRNAIAGAHREALAGMIQYLQTSNRPALMRHVPAARERLALMQQAARGEETSG